jgi:hypothetical protein
LSPGIDNANLAGMKLFKWIAISIVVGVGLIYLTLMVGRIFTPTLQDADLAVTRKTVAESDNGFTHLQTAAAQLWWPEDQKEQFNHLARGTNWNAELAATVLSSNSAALTAMTAALAAPEFQVPEYKYGEDVEYPSTWRALANLAAVRIHSEFKAGQEREAFAHTMDLIRLANRMQSGDGPILDFLIGSAVKQIALTTLRQLTVETRISSDELSALAADLPRVALNFAALTNALKAEYQAQKQFAVDLREGKIPGEDDIPAARIALLPVYNARKTQGRFANHTRDLLPAIQLPFSEARLIATNSAPNTAKVMLSGNAVGEIIYMMSAAPVAESAVRRKSSEHVQIKVTATFLALKAYQLNHGRLPAELSELVPQFLSAVPMDDFDGQPLRYDRERKILYSVSTNCQDDGGVQKDSRKPEPDWVFPIPF